MYPLNFSHLRLWVVCGKSISCVYRATKLFWFRSGSEAKAYLELTLIHASDWWSILLASVNQDGARYEGVFMGGQGLGLSLTGNKSTKTWRPMLCSVTKTVCLYVRVHLWNIEMEVVKLIVKIKIKERFFLNF